MLMIALSRGDIRHHVCLWVFGEFGVEFEVAHAGGELANIEFDLGETDLAFATGDRVDEFLFDVFHGVGEGGNRFAVLDGFVADPGHDGERDCAE